VCAGAGRSSHLLPREDETLLVRRDALLVLDLGLDGLDGVVRLHLEGDGLAREGLDEDLRARNEPFDRERRTEGSLTFEARPQPRVRRSAEVQRKIWTIRAQGIAGEVSRMIGGGREGVTRAGKGPGPKSLESPGEPCRYRNRTQWCRHGVYQRRRKRRVPKRGSVEGSSRSTASRARSPIGTAGAACRGIQDRKRHGERDKSDGNNPITSGKGPPRTVGRRGATLLFVPGVLHGTRSGAGTGRWGQRTVQAG